MLLILTFKLNDLSIDSYKNSNYLKKNFIKTCHNLYLFTSSRILIRAIKKMNIFLLKTLLLLPHLHKNSTCF